MNGARHTNIVWTFVVQSLTTTSPKGERPPVLLLRFYIRRDWYSQLSPMLGNLNFLLSSLFQAYLIYVGLGYSNHIWFYISLTKTSSTQRPFLVIPVYPLPTTVVSSRLYSEIGNLRRFQSFSNYGPNQLCTIQTLILYHRYISLVSLKLHWLGFPNHEPKPQLYIYKSY